MSPVEVAVEVRLTQGLSALIDECDARRVFALGKWHAAKHSGGRRIYVKHAERVAGRVVSVFLHTFLTGWSLVDHINGNGLDNRRANLREATTSQNGGNRRVSRNNSSGFKGVCRSRHHWRAFIVAEGNRLHLGMFDRPEDAARAYDEAAREHFGEFAALNFPIDGERGAR